VTDLATSPNDLGASYAARIQEASAADTMARLRSLAGPVDENGLLIPDPNAVGQIIEIRPRGVRPDEPPEPEGLGTGSGGGVGSGRGPGLGNAPAPAEPAAPADRAGIVGEVVDAAGRVLRNVGDATTQIVGAPLGALREMFRAADDIGNWLAGAAPVAEDEATFGANPGRAIARNIPTVPEPDTPAGRVVKDVAQFLAGFIGAGRVVRGIAGAARGAAGVAAQGMAAGAIADFFASDPNQARLAELWQEAGLPSNALTDYLADRSDDSQAEARLKQAIEGTATGAVVEALVATARGFRAALRAREAQGGAPLTPAQAEAAAQAARDEQARLVEEALTALGNPDRSAPLVTMGPPAPLRSQVASGGEPAAKMAAAEAGQERAGEGAARALDSAGRPVETIENTPAIRAATEPGEVYINWARVQAPEDVQAVMRDMADAFRPEINEAARSVQSNEATKALADQLGLTVEQLLSRRRGEPWNAETALAARRLWEASGAKLTELAQRAASPNATAADEYAFRRMMAVHYAIQAEVLAARRETARALQAWSIPAGSGAEQARAIQQMLEQHGGIETSQAIARRLVALSQAGANPAAVNAFVARGVLARGLDAVQEFWVNALLSSPKTHLVNIASNAFVAAQQVFERRVAEAIGDSVAEGEAAAMLYGLVTGLRDAFRLAATSYRDGTGEIGTMLGKVDVPHDRAISTQALGLDPGSGLGRAIDFIGHSVVNAPSRALGAEDAFFKSIGFRMELHAGALRMARDEVLSEGKLLPGSRDFAREVADRQARLIANPPEALRLQAADQALYQTFNRETWDGSVQVVRGLMALREKIPGLTFVLPFIRTPANIISYSFERTPLAPLVGQWRADIVAGGARRDLALARLATGSAAMALAFDMADRGLITGRGPDDPGEVESLRNQGVPAYAIRIGDQWFSYDRADPLGFLFGFAADTADMLRRREVEPEEVDEVAELLAAGIATVSRSVVDKTWMQGLASVIEALDRPEQGAQAFLQQFAGSFVPAVVAQTEQALSPERSELNSITDAVLARIPALSSRLPPRRNRWGEVIVPDNPARAAFDAFSPVRVTDLRESSIDAELQRLNLGIERIQKRVDFDGAPVNLAAYPGAYDDYVRLAGNDWKDPTTGLGLKDTLDEMVQGRGPWGATYMMQSDGRDGGKAIMIRNLVQFFRAGARQALLEMPEHADLAATVRARQEERVQRRMPQMQ